MTIKEILENHRIMLQHGTNHEQLVSYEQLLIQFTKLASMYCEVSSIEHENVRILT